MRLKLIFMGLFLLGFDQQAHSQKAILSHTSTIKEFDKLGNNIAIVGFDHSLSWYSRNHAVSKFDLSDKSVADVQFWRSEDGLQLLILSFGYANSVNGSPTSSTIEFYKLVNKSVTCIDSVVLDFPYHSLEVKNNVIGLHSGRQTLLLSYGKVKCQHCVLSYANETAIFLLGTSGDLFKYSILDSTFVKLEHPDSISYLYKDEKQSIYLTENNVYISKAFRTVQIPLPDHEYLSSYDPSVLVLKGSSKTVLFSWKMSVWYASNGLRPSKVKPIPDIFGVALVIDGKRIYGARDNEIFLINSR